MSKVAYTLSMLGEITKRRKTRIWATQAVDDVLPEALVAIATAVNEDIIRPPQGRKEGCWTRTPPPTPS